MNPFSAREAIFHGEGCRAVPDKIQPCGHGFLGHQEHAGQERRTWSQTRDMDMLQVFLMSMRAQRAEAIQCGRELRGKVAVRAATDTGRTDVETDLFRQAPSM